jgi:radical SAM family uncharacterized protein
VSDIRARIETILPHVRTPGQYVGGEVNSIVKPPASVAVTFCLAFPETYALGMSHVGLKILYEVLNRRADVAAERVFAPWVDMADLMRRHDVPLYALESFRPVREFDCVGFSLQYELLYTNVLAMLELARIPVRAADRTDADPIVIAGGPGAYNPEPTAAFIDAYVLGDGEEAVNDVADALIEMKGRPRGEKLLRLARIAGVYVPSLYEVKYRPDGRLESVRPARDGVPERVERRVVRDLDAAPYPTSPVVPFVETVHDRYAVEIMRGCVNACRFCQAGVNYRPRRERSLETVLRLAREGVARTGYDEVSLLSLSSGDYGRFGELVRALSNEFTPQGVSLSLPSLRVDMLLKDVPPAVSGVRKSGLTIAPECASDRMRRLIAKPIQNADLYAGAKSAYEAGWETVKLYFMIGLPGETDADVGGIADMANEVLPAQAHGPQPGEGEPLRLDVRAEGAHAAAVGADGLARGNRAAPGYCEEGAAQRAHQGELPRPRHDHARGGLLARRPATRRGAPGGATAEHLARERDRSRETPPEDPTGAPVRPGAAQQETP